MTLKAEKGVVAEMMKKYDISAEEVQKLRQAARLDDESFAKLLSAVTRALGASERQISTMLSSSGAVRAMISRASDRDIRSLAARIGREKTSEILGMIDSALSEEKT
jgi:hypothetical protein